MLGAVTCLPRYGISTDAAESRMPESGVTNIEKRAGLGTLAPVLVIQLGTNWPITSSEFDRVMTAASKGFVYWMTIHVPRDYTPRSNAEVVSGVARWPGKAAVIDWKLAADQHPAWLYSDGTHLTPAGCLGFAATVATALHRTRGTSAR